MTLLKVSLPWPPRELWPNEARRLHWAVKASIFDKARSDAFYATKAIVSASQFDHSLWYPVVIIFVKNDHHRFDLDNALASCKPYLDGICSAIEVDDYYLMPITVGRKIERDAQPRVDISLDSSLGLVL